MLQRHAPVRAGSINGCSSPVALARSASRHLKSKRHSFGTQVPTSALLLTVKGFTLSTAEPPLGQVVGARSAAAPGAASGLHHARCAGAASAAPQQAAASTSAHQQSAAGQTVVGQTSTAIQHGVQSCVTAVSAVMQAADAARQRLWQLLAAQRGGRTVIAVVLGAALLLLLTLKLQRRYLQGRRRVGQSGQDAAASDSLAQQKHRLLQALDEFVEEEEDASAADMQTFEAILDDYRFLLDNRVRMLDADGLPIAEGIISPAYSEPDAGSQEVQRQWAEFVAAAKLDAVQTSAWWDMADVEEKRQVVSDDIDWNA